MKIGYARVCTGEQNLDLQLDALKAAGCETIFMDQGISGNTRKRAGLSEALLSIGKEDILIAWKLDRLGRSLGFLCELVERLKGHGAGFHSLTEGIDTTTNGGKLVFHIMGALAEFERDLLRDRVRSGVMVAQARGVVFGRRLGQRVKSDKLASKVLALVATGQSYRKIGRELDLSKNTVLEIVKRERAKLTASNGLL